MADSAARAERFDEPVAPFYTWSVPQKPVAVRIPLGLVDRLEKEAVESFRSLTSRGSEIGGVLLGTVAPGDPLVVSIAEYELVPCDYSRGPLYRLSDSDSARFDLVKVPSGLRTIGFFRSHTRKGLALDADDLALMEGRFRDPHHVALVIRPNATKTSIGGVFIREGSSVHAEASYLEFPFRSAELAPTKIEPAVETEAAPSQAASSAAAKPAARAQIVPIASRRDVPPAASVVTPEPVAAPPAPVAAPTPAAQPVAKAAPTPEKQVPVEASKPAAAPEKQPQVQAVKPPVPPPAPQAARPAVPDKPVNGKGGKPMAEKPLPPKNVKPNAVPEKAPEKAPDRPPVVEAAKPAPAEKPAAAPEKPAPAAEKPVPAEAAKSSAPPEKAAAPVIPLPVDSAKSKKNKAMWFAVGAAFPILLSGVLFVYPGVFRKGGTSGLTRQDSSALALHVERNAGELILTWNRDSEVIRNASRAVLSITDGQQHEDAQMDLAQLKMGSIQYSPATADVVFSMEVWGKDQSKTTSELVRVMRTPRPSPMADDQAAQPQKNGQPALPPQSPATAVPAPGSPAAMAANGGKNTTPQPNTPVQTPNGPEQDPNAQPEDKVNLTRPTRQFNTASLSQRLRPVSPSSELPDAPSVGSSGMSSGTPGLSSIGAALPPAPPRPDAPAAPAPPATTAIKAPSGGQIKQAELISRKNPEYPKLARDAGAKGAVELTATIGTDGKVKSVKVVSGHPLLQRAAIDAVMQWKYKPTILNGVAVESQSQIVLNFVGDR